MRALRQASRQIVTARPHGVHSSAVILLIGASFRSAPHSRIPLAAVSGRPLSGGRRPRLKSVRYDYRYTQRYEDRDLNPRSALRTGGETCRGVGRLAQPALRPRPRRVHVTIFVSGSASETRRSVREPEERAGSGARHHAGDFAPAGGVVKRGEIWWASLPALTAPLPDTGARLSSYSRTISMRAAFRPVIVAAITSNLSLAEAPGNFAIAPRRTGLTRKSTVKCGSSD